LLQVRKEEEVKFGQGIGPKIFAEGKVQMRDAKTSQGAQKL
jgi:hypothetical protein